MKNLIVLDSKQKIIDFVAAQWKTDLFRKAHLETPNGFLSGVVNEFSYIPRFFAEVSNDHLERAHFSTWWGVIMLREYDNPYIHDLYLLHEMYHAAKMPYFNGIGKGAFAEKMQRNELEASVMSEIQVYFEMPELRALSFQHPIYADRFLGDPKMVALWNANRSVARETFRTIRRDVMISKPEHQMDLTERWVRRFAEQNDVYTATWSSRYNEIETRMANLQYLSSLDFADAAAGHAEWILKEAANDPVDNIPFREEAELFSAFYWSNKRKHDKAMGVGQ